MKDKNLAFIDIETTGFDVENQEIIEIGGVIVKQNNGDFEVLEEFEMKIKPEKIENADPEALQINGYDEAQWLFAISLNDAMKAFAEKTKGCVMLAHNIAFDYSFLVKAFSKTGVKNEMFFAKIDTISFAFAKFYNNDEVNRFSLKALCEYFGIENEKAHTALADARVTFELYKELVKL